MSNPHIDEARRALRAGEWATAKEQFEAALGARPSAEAFDGLAVAAWWLRDTSNALQLRARAYTAFRDEGRPRDAARVAVWLAREHRDLYGDGSVADGWLLRARRCLDDAGDDAARGWLTLATAESAPEGGPSVDRLLDAAAMGRRAGDWDLELIALARAGVSEIGSGSVESGIAHLDEAMAAATGGEGCDPRAFGEACCALMEAADLLGDPDRLARWKNAISDFLRSYDYPPLAAYGSPTGTADLSSFCGACCGGIYLMTGRIDEAEKELLDAIARLEETGMRSRCVHPVTQLAELRTAQGRFEEARILLEAHQDLPEAIRPLAALELAQGNPSAAAALLEPRIDILRDRPVVAFPLLTLLVDAELARGDNDAAGRAAAEITSVADLTGTLRHRAEAVLAQGKVAAAIAPPEAPELLRSAATLFTEASLPFPACRARFARAQAIAGTDRAIAITEARAALAAFERLGATVEADAAAAFLRGLGVKGRTGPKVIGALTRREIDVLRLVAEGLSNQQIADRLFISVKTAGHHVSNILAKLDLRSRTEAAAYAALNLPKIPVSK